MHIRYVIWDWNGTLINDAEIGVAFIDRFLKQHGRAGIGIEGYREAFCFPVRDIYRALGFDFEDDQDYERLARLYHDEYEAKIYGCTLHRGSREMLACLHARGIRQSIFSGLPQDQLDRHVEHFNVREFFEQVCGCANTYSAGKLDQTQGLLERLGFEPSATVLIGDTTHDADVAGALGVDCLLVAQGCNSFQRLARSGRPVFASLEHAAAYLEERLPPHPALTPCARARP